MRFWMSLLLALLFAGSASAIDYDKVERRLVKEPAYQSKKPAYALLLFGPEARLAVWVVLDGETLYLDRNGNGDLTDKNERFAKEADCKDIEIADPDGKTRYLITSLRSDYSTLTPKARKERQAKGLPLELMVNVTIKGPIEYAQYCDVQEMSDDPKKSMLAHFHGPLSMGVRTINWKVPKGLALLEGEKPSELFVMIGTMSAKHGCWVVVRTDAGKVCAFPNAVRPVAKVEFPPSDPKAKPIEKTYTLDTFC